MSGVLGLTRPANPRDRTGVEAYRLNSARERLIKKGRPVGLLTRAELVEEADRWDAEQADVARRVEAERESAEEQHRAFMRQYRSASVGDTIGPDEHGRWYRLDDDEDLIEVAQP